MLYKLSKILDYKIRNYLILFFISGSYIYLIFFPSGTNIDVCIFKKVTGVPCPGCGGTRAMELLLNGHIKESLLINPSAILIFIFSVVVFFWLVRDITNSDETFQNLLRRKWNKWYFYPVLAFILMNWIWNIMKGL